MRTPRKSKSRETVNDRGNAAIWKLGIPKTVNYLLKRGNSQNVCRVMISGKKNLLTLFHIISGHAFHGLKQTTHVVYVFAHYPWWSDGLA